MQCWTIHCLTCLVPSSRPGRPKISKLVWSQLNTPTYTQHTVYGTGYAGLSSRSVCLYAACLHHSLFCRVSLQSAKLRKTPACGPQCICVHTACSLLALSYTYPYCLLLNSKINDLLVQGDSATPMAGLEGEATTSSAVIHDLARLLQCDPSPSQALPVLQAISAAIDQLLSRLPPAFLEPILPPGSLNNQQVFRIGFCMFSASGVSVI